MTNELSLDGMRLKAEALRQQACLQAIDDLLRVNDISISDAIEHLQSKGENVITDQQRLVDQRRRTANSNRQLANLAKAREVKATNKGYVQPPPMEVPEEVEQEEAAPVHTIKL